MQAVPSAMATTLRDGSPIESHPDGQAGAVQLAQAAGGTAGELIGAITEVVGAASVIRAGAAPQPLALGDSVFQDDVLITQPGASVTVTFIDGTLFSLAGDGRLVLDRMIYDPAGSDNELLVSLLKGSFSFITGEVNKTGGPGMQLETPVGTIGVRGTAVVGDYDLLRLLITLLQGQILFSNAVAQALLATAYDTLDVGSASQSDLTLHSMTEAEQSVYGLLLPKILELVTPEAGQEDEDGDGGPGGTRILPFVPDDGGDGTGDDGSGGSRGEIPDFIQEALQDIADQIVDELIEANSNLILLVAGEDGGGDGAGGGDGDDDGAPDGSFETGFTGWETTGVASIEQAGFGSGPTEGLNQALITTGDGAQDAETIETQLGLGLAPGSLTALGNGTATEGAVIMGSFTLEAGDVLSFDFNFLTNEIPAPDEINDFAFVALTGPDGELVFLAELADTQDPLVASDTSFVDETGFATFVSSDVAPITVPGDFLLTIGVMDVDDDVFDSGLLVDNVTVTPAVLAAVEA